MKKILNLGLLFLSVSGSIISCASGNEIITQENNAINNVNESKLKKANRKDNSISPVTNKIDYIASEPLIEEAVLIYDYSDNPTI